MEQTPTPTPLPERRRFPRVSIEVRSVSMADPTRTWTGAKLVNASPRGLYLALADTPPSRWDAVIVTLQTDSGDRIVIEGVVMHVVPESGERRVHPSGLPIGVGIAVAKPDRRWTEFCTRAAADSRAR